MFKLQSLHISLCTLASSTPCGEQVPQPVRGQGKTKLGRNAMFGQETCIQETEFPVSGKVLYFVNSKKAFNVSHHRIVSHFIALHLHDMKYIHMHVEKF